MEHSDEFAAYHNGCPIAKVSFKVWALTVDVSQTKR